MIRLHKRKSVETLQNIFKKMKFLIILDIHGINAENVEKLRRTLHKKNLHMKVFKNKLVKYIIQNSNMKSISNDLKGQTAFVWDCNSTPDAAKVLTNFNEKTEKVKLICGFHNGKRIDIEYLNYLSTITNMDDLRKKLLYILLITSKKIMSSLHYQSLMIINILKNKYK